MSDVQRIRTFLRAVRRRAIAAAGLRIAGLTCAAVILALVVLALCATRTGPAGFWPGVTTALVGGLFTVGLAALWAFALRRYRTEWAVARLVGRRHPGVASDLLSAVEFSGRSLADPEPALGSSSMTSAFLGVVAARVEPLDPKAIVPLRTVAVTVGAFGLVVVAGLVALPFVGPVRRGLALLLHRPNRFEGAAIATQPLVGEMRITYEFPAYTARPKRVVEGSTGDIVAVKGTRVKLEAQVLRSARKALLLLGERGEGGERDLTLAKGKVSTSFVLSESGSYRVWLSPLIGRPVREQRAHRIVVEADQPPRVEIMGPADRLELPAPRPVEVGYQATDDFGLGPVDLVYKVDDGPEQRIRLRDGQGGLERSAQGRTVFEPDVSRLSPGGVVTYRIEAKDRDDVSGAKIGASRTLALVIQNPRDNLDERLVREKEILEKLLENLADRLELADSPLAANAPVPETNGHLAAWMALHETEEAQVAALGRVIDDERRGGAAGKPLLAALAGIADRLGRVLRDEGALLGPLRTKADEGKLAPPGFAKLLAHAPKHVQELETAVLLLDDQIGRQRLEDLAGLAHELTDAYKRLQDLLARYQSTKDEALKQQLAREIRDLKARMEELARKIEAVKARNEVSSEWQNMPDVGKALQKAGDFDALLEKGDSKALSQALADLGHSLESLRKALDKNASDFEGERFPQESRALEEFVRKIGDLEGDERDLAGDGQGLSGELDQEISKRMAGELDAFVNKTKEKIDKLKEKLGAATPRELGEDATDELRRAQESTKQLKRLLGGGKEWGEAKREAERAASSLRKVRKALDERAASKKPTSPAFDPFSKQMGEAGGIAQDLARDLEKLVPKGQELLSPEQQQRAQGMGERQDSLGERAQELAKEAQRKGGQVPGMEQASQDLKSVGEQMGQASGDFSQGNVKEGAGKARDAAERLAKLRDQMQNGRQGSRGRQQREPVRIPGVDDSKAPREWRQELMEAMRERAPERYNDEVKKYYEELVK